MSYIVRQVEQKNCEELCQLVLQYYRDVLERSCICAGAAFKVLDPEAVADMLYGAHGYEQLMAEFTGVDAIVLYSGRWIQELQELEDDEIEDCLDSDSSNAIRNV